MGVLVTSQTKTWVVRFELILQDDRQSRYWNNRNHTVGRLRSSNWIVEGYHQYRHDMEMQIDFRYLTIEFGVLDIVIVLEFFFPSCAPFNMYTCGNNLLKIDESVNCMNRVTRVNYRFRLR